MLVEQRISNQDFQIVKQYTNKCLENFSGTYNFTEESIAFEFFILEKIFNLQEDEIIESITDTCFQNKIGRDSGPDRGIDAIKIDEENKIIHFFNFKYTNKDLERTKDSYFESNEIDKILSFIKDLYEKSLESFSEGKANSLLKDKVEEIWKLQNNGLVFKYKIHLVSNIFKGLIIHEDGRFSEALAFYKGEIDFDYILIEDIVNKIIQRTEKLNSKFRSLNNNFFDKSDFGRRALIIEVPAIDLLRIVSDNKEVRNDCDCDNRKILESKINEFAFSDNVRVYLKEKTNINQNIKNTALDNSESEKMFFYNNGITITCEKIVYQGNRNIVVDLQDLQIVNGGQTIHALRSAFEEDQGGFEKITLLCKIFETNNTDFKNKIAEYTNSQNPVNDRDIRSIDTIQIKLEKDFENIGYFYARKKFQYDDKDKKYRIDAEKLGQAIMAFSLEMPAEAKNRKSLIFGEKYEEIFNDSLTAKNALEILNLYKEIEEKKLGKKDKKPYLLHSTYYIMFFIKKVAKKEGVMPTMKLYKKSLKLIEKIIENEKTKLKEDYSDAVLFKSNRPKEYLTELDL